MQQQLEQHSVLKIRTWASRRKTAVAATSEFYTSTRDCCILFCAFNLLRSVSSLRDSSQCTMNERADSLQPHQEIELNLPTGMKIYVQVICPHYESDRAVTGKGPYCQQAKPPSIPHCKVTDLAISLLSNTLSSSLNDGAWTHIREATRCAVLSRSSTARLYSVVGQGSRPSFHKRSSRRLISTILCPISHSSTLHTNLLLLPWLQPSDDRIPYLQ